MSNIYKVVPSSDAPSEMAKPTCETTNPRYSLDGTLAMLRYSAATDGSITHADAMTLLSTEAWTLPPSDMEIPQ
jgi:hypothetical protein|tara:strand:+ start:702 stop:923 length:222 start_codon:yes stop_codon:yes gene_type:complete